MEGKIYDAVKRVQCLLICLSRHEYMKSTVQVKDLASDTSNNRSSMVIGRKAGHIHTHTGRETYVALGVSRSSLLNVPICSVK